MKWLPEQIIAADADCTPCYAAAKSSGSLTVGHVLNTLTVIKRRPAGVAGVFSVFTKATQTPDLMDFYLTYSLSL